MKHRSSHSVLALTLSLFIACLSRAAEPDLPAVPTIPLTAVEVGRVELKVALAGADAAAKWNFVRRGCSKR